jgi:hypothetical protein
MTGKTADIAVHLKGIFSATNPVVNGFISNSDEQHPIYSLCYVEHIKCR